MPRNLSSLSRCGNDSFSNSSFSKVQRAPLLLHIYLCQVFGRKKSATAVAYCKRGKGLIKVNGRPLELVQPEALSFKLQEPILLLGKDRSGLFNTVYFNSMMNFIFTDLFRTDMLQQNT